MRKTKRGSRRTQPGAMGTGGRGACFTHGEAEKGEKGPEAERGERRARRRKQHAGLRWPSLFCLPFNFGSVPLFGARGSAQPACL